MTADMRYGDSMQNIQNMDSMNTYSNVQSILK